jgi:uncharacterized protein YkwD
VKIKHLLYALALLGVACGASRSARVATPEPVVDPVPIADRYASGRLELLRLINQDRSANGAPSVTLDSLATVVAQAHAEAMAAEDFFSHYGWGGDSPYERVAEAGGTAHVRENIFRRVERNSDALTRSDPWFDFEVEDAEEWLMASAGHRESIVDAHRTGVGIGIAVDQTRHTVFVVQDFVAQHIDLEVPARGWRRSATVVRGRVRFADWRPLVVILRKEPVERAWVAAGQPPPSGPYHDGEGKGAIVPPWAIEWQPTSRSFELVLPLGRLSSPGRYYGIVYVAPGAVVDGAIARRSVNSEDGWPGGAFVIDLF